MSLQLCAEQARQQVRTKRLETALLECKQALEDAGQTGSAAWRMAEETLRDVRREVEKEVKS